jgi:tetratricopeptide (TPR) repeat protein
MWLIWFLLHFVFSYWGIILLIVVLGPWIAEKIRFVQRRNDFLQHQKSNLINPNDADARFQLARLYLDGKRWKPAERYYGEAVEIYQRRNDVPFDKLYLGLAQSQFKQGKFQEAISNSLKALEVTERGTYGEAPLLLALAYRNEGDRASAKQWAEKAMKENGTLSQAFYLAGTLSEKEQAREYFKKSVEAYRESPPFMRSTNRPWALKSSIRKMFN